MSESSFGRCDIRVYVSGALIRHIWCGGHRLKLRSLDLGDNYIIISRQPNADMNKIVLIINDLRDFYLNILNMSSLHLLLCCRAIMFPGHYTARNGQNRASICCIVQRCQFHFVRKKETHGPFPANPYKSLPQTHGHRIKEPYH